MEQIDIISELYNKYKKNSKLPAADKEKVRESLVNLLREGQARDAAIDFIIKFPEDTGLAAYMEYYKTLNFENQKNLNAQFVYSKEFLANVSSRSINRGTALIGYMYKENLGGLAGFILRNVCNLIVKDGSKDISSKVIEAFQKNILNDYSEQLSRIRLDKYKDKDYYQIEKVIINSAFEPIKGQAIKPLIQYGILIWLIESERKIKLTGHEKDIVQDALNHWPDEMKKILNSNIDFKEAYEGSINFEEVLNTRNQDTGVQNNIETKEVMDQKSAQKNNEVKEQMDHINEEVTGYDIEKHIDQRVNEVKSHNVQKTERLKDILLRVAKEVDALENELKAKEEKIEVIKEISNSTQKQYEQKLIENEKLARMNDNYVNENNSLKSEIESLRIERKLFEEELSRLKEKENESKKKIEELIGFDASEDSNALKEFKNKLAGKLKHYHLDFMEVENRDMSNEFGEVLRENMKSIFNELIRQGIL